MRYPGLAARHDIPEPVSDVDLAPTFAEIAGVTPATPVDGRSILPLLQGQTGGWPTDLLIRGFNETNDRGYPPSYWGLRTDRFKYIETVLTGEVELYDLASDPYELTNVAEQPEYADTRAQLAQRLAELRAEPPHTAESQPAEPDPGTYLTYEPDAGYCNDPEPGPRIRSLTPPPGARRPPSPYRCPASTTLRSRSTMQ